MKKIIPLAALVLAFGTACGGIDDDGSSRLAADPQAQSVTTDGLSTATGSVGAMGVCLPGVKRWQCFDGSGVPYSGVCGAYTYKWARCDQFQDPNGKWYRQNCGPMIERCTDPYTVYDQCFQTC